jgi:hypothetical protein
VKIASPLKPLKARDAGRVQAEPEEAQAEEAQQDEAEPDETWPPEENWEGISRRPRASNYNPDHWPPL